MLNERDGAAWLDDRSTGSGRRVSGGLMAVALALAVLVVASAVLLAQGRLDAFTYTALAHSLVYLAGVVLVVRRGGRPGDLLLILAVAVVLRAIAMQVPPALTTDAFRYVWDGRIQWYGWNPYLYVPADEKLAYLRDAVIFPNIHKKDVAVTIYPPFAEMLFMLANALADGLIGIKLVMAAFEAVTILVLIRWLAASGLPRERVLIYAWHPLPMWEFSSMGHIDAAATGLLMLALFAVVQRRQGLAGVLFAVAVLTKYFPIALMPAVWRRWNWRMPAAFVVTAIVLFLPYVFGAGPRVLGYLGSHLDSEGYAQGFGFHVIWLLRDFSLADPSGKAWVVVALATLAGLAGYTFFARGRDEVRPAHLVLMAATFVWLTSPHYPWYFGWIVPLVALHLSPAALAMTLICLLQNYPLPSTEWVSAYFATVFGTPLVVALAAWAIERRRATAQ